MKLSVVTIVTWEVGAEEELCGKLIVMSFLKKLFGQPVDLKALYEKGAVILDVRTAAEFRSGHVEGSINIPLDRLQSCVEEIQKLEKPVIACCQSGGRSGMAVTTLQRAGVEAYNGGGWQALAVAIKTDSLKPRKQ